MARRQCPYSSAFSAGIMEGNAKGPQIAAIAPKPDVSLKVIPLQ
jgi:hypothetical protein